MGPAQLADTERDTIAFLGAVLADDYAAATLILRECDTDSVLGMLAGMLFAELAAHDIDPAEWVQAAQARTTAEAGL